MTKEEIIRNLKYMMEKHKNDTVRTFDTNISVMCKDILDYLEQEPCEDVPDINVGDIISRQALDEIKKLMTDINGDTVYAVRMSDVRALPPVTPQPKTGYWIVEVWNNKEHHTCSNCQHVVTYEPCYHYCPYCGAKMVEPQESEG